MVMPRWLSWRVTRALVYAHFDHPSDVLSAIFADNSVYPEFPPLSINAPCGCWNPIESSMVMGTENDNSFLDFPVFALNEYDTFWTIGKLSNNEPGNNPSWFSSPNVDGANICNSVVENGAVFLPYASHPTNPNAVAGDDLRIVIARITTCGDFEVSGAMQIFELGDQQNARRFQCFRRISNFGVHLRNGMQLQSFGEF